MTAQSNAFALVDSLTSQIYAYVVDAPNPPGALSPNNTYWRAAFTAQTGNPLIAVTIPIATYNSSTTAQLLTFITNAIALLQTVVL